MKQIAIFHCLRAQTNCAGAACLSALQKRKGTFAKYAYEEVQLVAFGTCIGCGTLTLGPAEGLEEKVQRILKIHPDAVHMGICCMTRSVQGKPCRVMAAIAKRWEAHGIQVVWGTHNY